MDVREERGKQIAETCNIRQTKETGWLVPSQSSATRYFVDLTNVEKPACTCPDFEERQLPCKHIYAVAYFVVRQKNPDGSTTVTETMTVTKRKTYPQNWPAYNAAQTNEQDSFKSCCVISAPESLSLSRNVLADRLSRCVTPSLPQPSRCIPASLAGAL